MHQHRPRGNGLWWVVRHICHMYPRSNLLCIMLQIKKIKCIYWTVIVNRFNSLLMIIISLYKYLQSLKKSSIKKKHYYLIYTRIIFTIRIICSFMFDIDVLRILLYFFQHHFFEILHSVLLTPSFELHRFIFVILLMYVVWCIPLIRLFFFHILRYMYFTLSLCIIILT